MVMAPDASTIMGDTQVDSGALDDLARGEYSKKVGEKMPRDYVMMYHPDGSTSIVQLPPLGKNGKNLGDRQRKLMHYVLNKRKAGKQWWFASPPPGWVAQETPWRCPVQECTRAGGLKDLLNLWRHIKHKHPGEVDLYQGVLTAIQKRLSEATAQNLDALFTGGGNDGEPPLVSEEDLAAAKFEDAAEAVQEMEAMPAVPPETFVPDVDVKHCDCGWADKKGTGMAMHQKRWCPLNKKEGS
jgi:hypothetical protein